MFMEKRFIIRFLPFNRKEKRSMEFLEACGKRRSVRGFKTWEPVHKEKIQRILEVVRLTTCPGNLQPWRAVVIERDKLDPKVRDQLLACDNWQGAHTQAPVWIYFYADPAPPPPDTPPPPTNPLLDPPPLPPPPRWHIQSIQGAIFQNEPIPAGMPTIDERL